MADTANIAPDDDDLELFTKFVENLGEIAGTLDTIVGLLQGIPDTFRVEYDDRAVRALESIADTLARLERS